MKPFKNSGIEKVILGCTHYPLFEELIRKEIGEEIELINTGKMVAKYVEKYLEEKNLRSKENSGSQEIYLTKESEKFKKIAENILNENIKILKTI